jgi:PTS system nitrogen regulatory IIA component
MQLTVPDAARMLDVPEKTIYRWIESRGMPAQKVSDQYRFSKAELLEWATAHKIKVAADLFQEAEGEGAALPSLSAALAVGGVFHQVPGKAKQEVLRATIERLTLPPEVDREFLLQVMLARETLGSTGIGDGIAIPHVRNPMVLHVPEASISISYLEEPIEFGALDGKPVHTLFSLISPTTRIHLHLLSNLGAALHDEGFRRAVLARASKDVVLAEAQRVERSFRRSGPKG